MLALKQLPTNAVPYIPEFMGQRELPPEEKPVVLWIKPLTVAQFDAIAAQVKYDSLSKQVINISFQEKLYQIISEGVIKVENLYRDSKIDDAGNVEFMNPINTGKDLIEFITSLGIEYKPFLDEIVAAIQSNSVLEKGIRKN